MLGGGKFWHGPRPFAGPVGWQRQKEKYLLRLVCAAALLGVCFALRFIPAINDKLSGPPEYMRWIADRTAHTLAAVGAGEDIPVLLFRDEQKDCTRVDDASVYDPNDLYYVVTYSEDARSVCFVEYGGAVSGSEPAAAVTIDPRRGRNLGSRWEVPVNVVPVQHTVMNFPWSYVSLLHWRARVDRSKFAQAGHVTGESSAGVAPTPSTNADIFFDFKDLRRAVARRHDAVNTALDALLLILLVLCALVSISVWILYRVFERELLAWRAEVSFRVFLRKDLMGLRTNAREAWQMDQQRNLDHARASLALTRSKEAARTVLEFLLGELPEGSKRQRIEACLKEDDLESMKVLIHELQGQHEKTPEERLTFLLETLKDFCSGEEYDDCSRRAFSILATSGFKEARSFVVQAHDEFRARQREAERQAMLNTESIPN